MAEMASLARRIAEIIDPTAYAVRPATYGLKTEQELMERTMAGPARRIAESKAKQIIKLVRVKSDP
jgi:hypothetical protein